MKYFRSPGNKFWWAPIIAVVILVVLSGDLPAQEVGLSQITFYVY